MCLLCFWMGPIMEAEFQNERGASENVHSGVKGLFLVTFIEPSSSSLMDIRKKKKKRDPLPTVISAIRGTA